MPKLVALSKLKSSAARYIKPDIRNYNRLEGSPRSRNFERNLAMECHDALWFLCRQWQFGEFQAEDAATACQARVLATHSTPGEIELANGKTLPFDREQPLETVVEQEMLAPTLRLRAQMGRQLIKLLRKNRLQRYEKLLASEFPLDKSVKDGDEQGLFLSTALPDSIPDGHVLYRLIAADKFKDWLENHVDVDAGDHTALLETGQKFYHWFHQLYQQPDPAMSAWDSSHLEYNFSLKSRHDRSGARRLVADQYASGHLDWKDFDQVHQPRARNLDHLQAPVEQVQTFIPTPLKFSGMPHPRLWQMEDSQINFGKLNASPTSVMNVLLAEYGLNFSNDWFVLPYELAVNTICQVQGILLKDVFGQQILIRPAVKDPETAWHQFTMFHQTERDNATRNQSLFYLSPSVGQKQESDDIERVNFIRDEMSNMVWAIEQVVASDAGQGRLVKQKIPSLDDFVPTGDIAKIRYLLGNTVPENWTPFVPVHKPVVTGQAPREIRLQRARMPSAVAPQGKLLNEVRPVYFIEEEEVPRSGIIINRRFQRTRWLNGKICLWMGRKKAAGKGEGTANLRFDDIISIDES